MGENGMYFAVGLDLWYDWVERSRNLMRRKTFNKKTMVWICYFLQEASRDKEAQMRIWKLKEQCALFFCSRENNKFGRFKVLFRYMETTDLSILS